MTIIYRCVGNTIIYALVVIIFKYNQWYKCVLGKFIVKLVTLPQTGSDRTPVRPPAVTSPCDVTEAINTEPSGLTNQIRAESPENQLKTLENNLRKS